VGPGSNYIPQNHDMTQFTQSSSVTCFFIRLFCTRPIAFLDLPGGHFPSVFLYFFFFYLCLPTHCRWRGLSLHLITLDDTLVGTPLYGESAHFRDLYLTTHNIHKRRASMPPVGFEPTIPASEQPQTHALDRAATGTGSDFSTKILYKFLSPGSEMYIQPYLKFYNLRHNGILVSS